MLALAAAAAGLAAETSAAAPTPVEPSTAATMAERGRRSRRRWLCIGVPPGRRVVAGWREGVRFMSRTGLAVEGIDADHGQHPADAGPEVRDLEQGVAVGDVVVLAAFVELQLTGFGLILVAEVRRA